MAITPSFVAVPAQSKSLDTNIVTTTEGIVHRQVVNISDPQSPTTHMAVGANGAYVDVRNVIALPLPSGAATSALQTTGNTSLSTIITNTTGVSTAANQTTGNASLSTIATNTTGLNSLTKNTGIVDANTIRVSPATDVTQAISAVSLPLPTGAATQTTLASIDAKFSELGQNTMAGSTPVVLASNHSDIYVKDQSSSYANITTTGTTTIKSGAGILRRLAINTKGSASNTFTIYDNTAGSGTVIATIDTVNAAGGFFEYGLAFSTGLTIVSATGISADATVIYE